MSALSGLHMPCIVGTAAALIYTSAYAPKSGRVSPTFRWSDLTAVAVILPVKGPTSKRCISGVQIASDASESYSILHEIASLSNICHRKMSSLNLLTFHHDLSNPTHFSRSFLVLRHIDTRRSRV